MPGHWAGSTRREQLPPNWAREIRPRILTRDNYQCTWVDERAVRCGETASDVDHIRDPHDHSDGNLRALCSWHHARKSSAEGNAARWRFRARRLVEPHPGLAR